MSGVVGQQRQSQQVHTNQCSTTSKCRIKQLPNMTHNKVMDATTILNATLVDSISNIIYNERTAEFNGTGVKFKLVDSENASPRLKQKILKPTSQVKLKQSSQVRVKAWMLNKCLLECWTRALVVVFAMVLVVGGGGVVSGAALGGGSVSGGSSKAVIGDICDLESCNCTTRAVVWKVVNCSLLEYQNMELTSQSIPDNLIELHITGGGTVTVHADAFLGLRGFNRLLIEGARALTLRTHAIHNLTTASVLVQVRRCDVVHLERGSVKNSETSVIIEISQSQHVTLEGSAFSRLQEARFSDIVELELQEGAFTFEHMRTYGRHGPVTNVSFHNVAIPRLPRACFSSALAEIHIRDTRISDIEAGAFKAKEISSISISNSSIGRLRSRAMIDDLHIVTLYMSKCHVHVVESGAILAAVTNFRIEHSRLDMLHQNAINAPVAANIHISDNEFRTLSSHSLMFNNWNHISINNNIIKHLHSNFLDISETTTAESFTFLSNEIYNLEDNSLKFVSDLERITTPASMILFDGNFFNQTCHCGIDTWLGRLTNGSEVGFIINGSYCTVDALLSNCFQLPEGLINMRNFTELVCGPESVIKCEPYNGETKVLDTTAIMLLDDIDSNSSSFVLILTLGSLFVIAIIATVIILLVRGAVWLDHKGYCDRFKLQQYSTNGNDIEEEEQVNTAEDTLTETVDLPEELTPELLQSLRERLEDPDTHNEAREMIEKLYEMFIIDDSYTNNNRLQEEAHLYEELGNLNLQRDKEQTKEPFPNDLLKLMEDFNVNVLPDKPVTSPKLVNEYSEPSDAEFHVYSELKQQGNDQVNDLVKADVVSDRKDSLKSTNSSSGSGKMAFRPLPAKPVEDGEKPGTSSQYKF